MADLASAIARLADVADTFAELDLGGEPELADSLVRLRTQMDRLEGVWLRGLAAQEARGDAAADGAASTRAWLRTRCRMHPRDAGVQTRTARALRELDDTAAALHRGEISARHAEVVAGLVQDLDLEAVRAAEPILLAAARRLDPGQLRRITAHLRHALDPDRAADGQGRQHARRRVSLSETFGGAFVLDGMLDGEGGSVVLAALTALSAPAGPDDTRTPAQRRADALVELARRGLDRGDLPRAGGERPHVNIHVDWDALRGERAGAADADWAGPVHAETARRAACDAAVAPLVTRDPDVIDAGHDLKYRNDAKGRPVDGAGGAIPYVDAVTRAARMALPPFLRNAPTQILEVGRATRVVSPAQRRALVARDRGCRFPGCGTPAVWTDAHHIRSWVHGGSTGLDNLALLCRRHHRAVHEGGWTIAGDPNAHLRFESPHGSWDEARPPPGSELAA